MKAKPSAGKRFAAGVAKIEKQGTPAKAAKAVMASAGRAKYGAKKMSQLASAGNKRKG